MLSAISTSYTTLLRNGKVNVRSLTTNSYSKPTQRPKRIILIRHGESLGNVDEKAYVTTPDWKVPITPKGRYQANEAGVKLNSLISADEFIILYYSPYLRTRQTVQEIVRHLHPKQIISSREEPRISEQQFGNFQNVKEVLHAKQERHDFGRFYYRFKSGEAGLDVYSRVSSFISTLVRDCQQYAKAGYNLVRVWKILILFLFVNVYVSDHSSISTFQEKVNIVIVTHGLSLRLFLMRWFQFSVEEFEKSKNPENAQLIVMKKRCVGGHRWYVLDEENRKFLNLPSGCGVPKNVYLHQLDEEK